MDITAVYENHNMLGGKVLFELELTGDEVFLLDAGYLGYAFTEPYDGEHLWFWAQVPLDDALQDMAFWYSVADGIEKYNGEPTSPTAEELLDMVERRLEEGNVEDFEERLN